MTLTHDELVLSGVIKNLDEIHDVRVIKFLQDGDLAVDIVKGARDSHQLSTVVGGACTDSGLSSPGAQFPRPNCRGGG